jgi:hypothetical protein
VSGSRPVSTLFSERILAKPLNAIGYRFRVDETTVRHVNKVTGDSGQNYFENGTCHTEWRH